MSKIIYLMITSLDGYIESPDGSFDWGHPDEEVHRFSNAQAKEASAFLYGRGMYETMKVWQTMDNSPDCPEHIAEFSRFWRETPKLVFTNTLSEVVPNTTLQPEVTLEVVDQIKRSFPGLLAVSGAKLASSFAALDLIDEYRLIVSPVLTGGGKAFFPHVQQERPLKLLETKPFASGMVYLRYGKA